MKKILLSLFLLSLCINIKAYENDYFKINIPNNYKEEIINDDTYKWSNDNNYVSISIVSNTALKYNIEAYTEKDIENQKKYIEENINNSLKEYKIKVNVTDINKVLLNNNYVLKYSVYWPTKDITGNDTYQIGNVFTTQKYIITILYSSNNEIDNEEYSSIINSFTIKDKISKVITYKEAFVFILVIGSALAIILVIIEHNKKS